MSRTVSLILAAILLVACSGCILDRRGEYGEPDRRGYYDRERVYHEGERGDRDRDEHGDRDRGEHGDWDRR